MMIYFKYDDIQLSLHKEPPEVGLVKKLTGSLYWWVEQCMPTLHRECYRNYYYYEFILRNDGFWQAPEIDFRYETKARKVMVDFKFDALYS